MLFNPVPVGKRTRYSYAKIKEVMEMPHLLDIQRNSYQWFLDEGLQDIFNDILPIQDFSGNLVLSFESFSLGEPKYELDECKERDVTLAAPIRVNVRLINRETGEIKEQEVFMGDFPLMTDTGTFIINGAERVIVSQLVRSPGAYYGEEIDPTGKHLYNATVIPNRGAWIELETDTNDVVSVRIDRTRKMPVTYFIRALGFATDEEIIDLFGEDPRIMNTLERDGEDVKSQGKAVIEIYRRLRPGEPANEDNAQQLLDSLFFDPKRYDLATVGRYKLTKKLGWKRRILGKVLAEPVVDMETGEIVIPANEVVTEAMLDAVDVERERQIFGEGQIVQLSEDHVERREGKSTRKAPLTQHLGIDPEEYLIEPYIAFRKYRSGDVYLVCSDGLTDMVPEEEIGRILRTGSLTDAAAALRDRALENGGRDNVTVLLCRIEKKKGALLTFLGRLFGSGARRD